MKILKYMRKELFSFLGENGYSLYQNSERGFKVKVDLILISADIRDYLDKILPLEPVVFKRKLAYGGSYIEELIDKKK